MSSIIDPTSSGQESPVRPSLDWNDRRAVSQWLGGLRHSLNDADAVSRDMLREPRERELGPAVHAKIYGDAWKQIVHAIEYATPPGHGAPGPSAGDSGGCVR